MKKNRTKQTKMSPQDQSSQQTNPVENIRGIPVNRLDTPEKIEKYIEDKDYYSYGALNEHLRIENDANDIAKEAKRQADEIKWPLIEKIEELRIRNTAVREQAIVEKGETSIRPLEILDASIDIELIKMKAQERGIGDAKPMGSLQDKIRGLIYKAIKESGVAYRQKEDTGTITPPSFSKKMEITLHPVDGKNAKDIKEADRRLLGEKKVDQEGKEVIEGRARLTISFPEMGTSGIQYIALNKDGTIDTDILDDKGKVISHYNEDLGADLERKEKYFKMFGEKVKEALEKAKKDIKEKPEEKIDEVSEKLKKEIAELRGKLTEIFDPVIGVPKTELLKIQKQDKDHKRIYEEIREDEPLLLKKDRPLAA